MEKRTLQPIVRKSTPVLNQLSIKLGVREKHRVLNLPIISEPAHDVPELSISQDTLLQKIQTKVQDLGIALT